MDGFLVLGRVHGSVSVAGPLLLSSEAELVVPLAVLVGWLLLGMTTSPLRLDLAKTEAYAQMQRRDQQSWVVVWESRRVIFLEGQR